MIGWGFLDVMVYAPLVGVVDGDVSLLHALQMEQLFDALFNDLESVTAACGVEALVLGKENTIYAWPIPVQLTTAKRCPECRQVAGGRVNRRHWPKEGT